MFLLDSLFSWLLTFITIFVFMFYDEPWDFKFPFHGFSTKTAYRYDGLQSYPDKAIKQLDQCELIHVNALFRHGTRAPSDKDLKKMKSIYDRLKNSHGSRIPEEFITTPFEFENMTSKELLFEGYKELFNLGQRFRTTMKPYFEVKPENMRFHSSSINRSIASGWSFYHGIFDYTHFDYKNWSRELCGPDMKNPEYCRIFWDDHTDRHKQIRINDDLLRFFVYCKRYVEEIEENKTAIIEYEKFATSPKIENLYRSTLKNLKITSEDLEKKDLSTIFSACGYGTAILPNSGKISPWCKLLKPDDFPVLEYLAELKHYWRKSYGYDLNYEQSCPLIGKMLTEIEHAANHFQKNRFINVDKGLHRASFWFGHAETLLPIVAVLGLFNDSVGQDHLVKLTSDGFDDYLRKIRTKPQIPTMFRAGFISPFAGNLALMLYHCPEAREIETDRFSGFYLKLIVNEQLVAWPLASEIQPATLNNPGHTFTKLTTVLNALHNCMPNVYDNDKYCSLDQVKKILI